MKNQIIIRAIIVMLCIVSSYFSYAQQKKSKEEIDFLIKLRLYQESSGSKEIVFNQESLNNFLQLEFEWDTLESEGFKYNIIFLKINSNFKNPKNISLDITPLPILGCNEYIIALNYLSGTIYKLKGFMDNEFSLFLKDLKFFKYSNLSYKRFIKNYTVENLDFVCLYKASKHNSIDKKRYPCIDDCLNIINIE